MYEYTLGDSTTAAYKALSTKVVGFSTGSMSAPPIPPKPQPTLEKPNDSKRDKEGHNDKQHPNTPPGDQGDDSEGRGPPGGGGPAPRLPLIPQ